MSDSSMQELRDQLADATALEAAEALGAQPHDVIRDVLGELSQEQALNIAAHLPGTATREQSDAAEVAAAVGGTVELLVEPAIGALPPSMTVAGAIDHLVVVDPQRAITYLFIGDENDVLLGVVTIRDLLLARPGQTLSEVMTPEPFALTNDTSITDAVREALVRRIRVYPVVSAGGVYIGQIPAWRLFEHVATEINAQSGAMVGVDKEERLTTPVWAAFRMRHPWLQVNLLTAFGAALVVGLFEDTIAQIVALAAFLPVLAGQSGNTGCQALAITLRGMTLGELRDFSVFRLLRKEVVLGAMNGFFVGIIAAAAMWLYAGASGTGSPTMLALVILIAMVGACVGSGIFGVLVPLTLKRFGADPAMASSIFLTTFTDVLGMGLMLFLATTLVL